jgi:hypothetical protein
LLQAEVVGGCRSILMSAQPRSRVPCFRSGSHPGLAKPKPCLSSPVDKMTSKTCLSIFPSTRHPHIKPIKSLSSPRYSIHRKSTLKCPITHQHCTLSSTPATSVSARIMQSLNRLGLISRHTQNEHSRVTPGCQQAECYLTSNHASLLATDKS